VTILTEKFREQRYHDYVTQMKQYTLNCIDGDRNYLTVKVNSKLHGNIHLLKEGAVIELLDCQPLYYHYEDMNDLRVCLLLSNFRVISHQNVPDNLKCAPTTTHHLRPIIVQSIEDETSALQSNNNGIEVSQDGWDNHDANGNEIERVKRVDCRGGPNGLCPMYGVQFETCICQAVPVKSLILHEIARECYFVSMAFHAVENRHKRNIVYWWYATNIYFICGSHNRAELPECLVSEVRRHFPNHRGTPYKGYRVGTQQPHHSNPQQSKRKSKQSGTS
jgi:hypothetical protein